MSSEQHETQNPPELAKTKGPENGASLVPAPETNRSTNAGPGADTEQNELNEILAILPVRGIVLFPGMVVPLTIGRPSAIKLVDSELPENKQLGLVTQRDEQLDKPHPSDICRVGVAAQVLKLSRQPDGLIIFIVQVVRRISLEDFV